MKENFMDKRRICMSAAMVLALFSGIGYAWSVFQAPLLELFGWSLEEISLTFTIQVAVSTIFPVFVGKYQKRLGTGGFLRIGIAVYTLGLLGTMFTSSVSYLYLVFGVIVGMGLGMLYPCLMSYSTRLFPEKPGLASGLLASAYGAGAFFWAPTAVYLKNQFGILAVFGILAGLFALVMLPVSFLIRSVPEDFAAEGMGKKKMRSGGRDYTWKEMLKTGSFYWLVAALTIGATSGLMITGHASNIFQEMGGMSAERAAVLVGLISVFNTCGRFLFGMLSDRIGRYNMMLILFGAIGGAMLLLSGGGMGVFVAAVFAIGAGYGGFTAMISPLCADTFGLKNLTVNYTFFYVAYGLAGIIGPQLASRIHTASGSYRAAFLTVAVMCACGFLIVAAEKAKKGKARRESKS